MQISRKARACAFPIAGGVLLLVFLLAAGCTGQSPALQLGGTQWTLTAYTTGNQTLHPLAGTPVIIAFGADGKLAGTAGCNRFFASWKATGSTLTIGEAGSTMMYCGEPGVMDQESAFLSLLPKAATYTSDGSTLAIADSSGKTILSFAKAVPPAPLPLAGTNWTLSSFHSSNAVSSVIAGTTITAVFEPGGNVAGSAGCNHYFGTYSVNGSSMTFNGLGSTKMMCPGEGIMNQESQYLAALESAAGYTITGPSLVLADRNGTALLTFSGRP